MIITFLPLFGATAPVWLGTFAFLLFLCLLGTLYVLDALHRWFDDDDPRIPGSDEKFSG